MEEYYAELSKTRQRYIANQFRAKFADKNITNLYVSQVDSGKIHFPFFMVDNHNIYFTDNSSLIQFATTLKRPFIVMENTYGAINGIRFVYGMESEIG